MKRTIAVLLIVTAVIAVSGSMVSQARILAEKPQKAIDPVCGLSVDKLSELSHTYKGETYYFCSNKDRDSFKSNPEKYLKKPAPGK